MTVIALGAGYAETCKSGSGGGSAETTGENQYGAAGSTSHHENHKRALELLRDGCYLIALMNKGNWTSSGHFVLVWWADNKICINDPNSTRQDRVCGAPYTFRSEVKYYWWVDARAYNRPQKPEIEEEIMTGSEILSALASTHQ